MPPPFLIHLVFHPASKAARDQALALHRALNADSALPGLTVPTVLLAEDGSGFPPLQHDLDQAEHSAVVVLIDDWMVVEETVPPGRTSWPDFVADIGKQCEPGKHRFLPVQLSKNAWPLHKDLKSINFIRAVTEQDLPGLERKIVVELCRFLLGDDRGTSVPITVFLSHAKQDIDKEPSGVFNEISKHLDATQPVETWIDSAKIEPGKSFATSIEDGLRDKDTAVLALLTSHYSSRPWCRREILFAKKYSRPLVVVDALDSIDLRAFPYMGNVATVAWQKGEAQRVVDLLLKEQLRHLHVKKLLERAGKAALVLTSPPELTTVISLAKGGDVLYPDPPLGDEEMEVLKALELKVETPLQRAAANRVISKMKIAVSISEADAPGRVGMFPDHLDAALLEISRHLLVRGATLAYGGHLGITGYTRVLFDLVRAHAETSGLPAVERIVSYIGWPVPLTLEQRAEFKNMATFVRVAMLPEVAALDPTTFVPEPQFFPASSPQKRYAWARGMTTMRERQSVETEARIAIGGKMGSAVTATPDGDKKVGGWYSGRIPGVVEEILFSLKANKRVYLCGAFGGATSTVIDLLRGKPADDFTWDWQKQAPYAEDMRALYDQHKIAWESYGDMQAFFAGIGVAGLSKLNRLTEAENLELFGCRDIPRLVELLVTGLTR